MARNTPEDLLDYLLEERGAIVSSADCSEMEIAFARKEGRLFVMDNSIGFVVRMKHWRENAEAALESVKDQQNDDKYGDSADASDLFLSQPPD